MDFKDPSDFTNQITEGALSNMFQPSDDKCFVSENHEINTDPNICSGCNHMDLSDVRDDTCRMKYCDVDENDIYSRFKRYSCYPVKTNITTNKIDTVCKRCSKKTFTVEKTPEELEEDERLRSLKESNMRTKMEEHDRVMQALRDQSKLQSDSNSFIQSHYNLPVYNQMSSNQHGHTHGHTHGHNTYSSSNSNSNSIPNFTGSTPTTVTATSVSNNNDLTGDFINSIDTSFGWNDYNTRRQDVLGEASGAIDDIYENGVVPFTGFNR